MRTPLPLACSFFAGLGLALALPELPHSPALVLACLGSALVVALTALRTAPRALVWLGPKLLCAACLIVGLCAAPQSQACLPPLQNMSGTARMRARVETVRYGRDGRAKARIRLLWGQRLKDGAPLTPGTELIATPFPMPEGAVVSLLARVRPTVPFRNPSPHPQPLAAHPTRGIARIVSADAIRVVSHPWPARWLDGLRGYVRTHLIATLAPDVEPIARTILLGDPDALAAAEANAVRGAGLSHVFAVSGMHVTLLAGITVWLLRRALLYWRWLAERYDTSRLAAALGVPLTLFIAAFTGGAPSGWRASITTAITWTVAACGRRSDPVAVSAAACMVFGIIAPADALRPAFVLSVAATAALIGQPRAVSSMLATVVALAKLNLRTTLATAPIVWWSFGTLPLAGLIANLLLVPIGSLLLLLTAAHALLACLSPALSACSSPLLEITARAFLRGAGACSTLAPQVQLPTLTLVQGLTLAGAVAGLLFVQRTRYRVYCVLGALAMCAVEEWRVRHAEQPTGELRATFVDVGQGDATIVDLPDGKVMLIDAGGNPQGGPDPGARALVPLLAARRRQRLDVVVLSHPHPDHYGGLAALIQAVPITELWDSGQGAAEADISETSARARELVNQAHAHGTRILGPAQLCGQPRRFGDATVSVLAPCPAYDPGFDPNDNSIVIRIDYAGRSLLLSGDIEGHAEHKLVSQGAPLQADVLKVPHHGSRTSSSEPLLRAVHPSIAVISAGAYNRFGHPHPEVTARLHRHVQRLIHLSRYGGRIIRVSATGALTLTR